MKDSLIPSCLTYKQKLSPLFFNWQLCDILRCLTFDSLAEDPSQLFS